MEPCMIPGNHVMTTSWSELHQISIAGWYPPNQGKSRHRYPILAKNVQSLGQLTYIYASHVGAWKERAWAATCLLALIPSIYSWKHPHLTESEKTSSPCRKKTENHACLWSYVQKVIHSSHLAWVLGQTLLHARASTIYTCWKPLAKKCPTACLWERERERERERESYSLCVKSLVEVPYLWAGLLSSSL